MKVMNAFVDALLVLVASEGITSPRPYLRGLNGHHHLVSSARWSLSSLRPEWADDESKGPGLPPTTPARARGRTVSGVQRRGHARTATSRSKRLRGFPATISAAHVMQDFWTRVEELNVPADTTRLDVALSPLDMVSIFQTDTSVCTIS